MIPEEGIGDYAKVMEVVFNGISMAGNFSKFTAEAAVKLLGLLWHTLYSCGKITYKAGEYIYIGKDLNKTGGKVSNRALLMQAQNQVLYDDIKALSGGKIAEKCCKENISELCKLKGLDEKTLADVVNNIDKYKSKFTKKEWSYIEKWRSFDRKEYNKEALKQFEKICVKAGLKYADVSNFIKNKDTGEVEFHFAFPKDQIENYREVMAQFDAWQTSYFEALKLNKEQIEQITKATTGDPAKREMPTLLVNSPVAEAVEKLSMEDYHQIMENTFPEYNRNELTPKEPSQETKDFFHEASEINGAKADEMSGDRKKVVIKDAIIKNPQTGETISNIGKDAKTGEIQFRHPDYGNVICTVKPEDINVYTSTTNKDGIQRTTATAYIKKDAEIKFSISSVNLDELRKNPSGITPTVKEVKMTYDNFTDFMQKIIERAKNMFKSKKTISDNVPQISTGKKK